MLSWCSVGFAEIKIHHKDENSVSITRSTWKKDIINWMAPYPKKKLIDMACGTGDLGKLFLESTKYESDWTRWETQSF